MARKRYYDSDYMIKNDESKIANMPTELKLAYYPENPSYYPETEIDDTMDGVDKVGMKARKNPDYVKGYVAE